MDGVFSAIKKDLYNVASQKDVNMTPAQKKSAEAVLEKFQCISDNLIEISSYKSDSLRNVKINELTKGGAEAGFSSSCEVLSERITLLLRTYSSAKEKNDLPGFFKCFSQGDPCLSGKMESLNKYAAMLEMGIDVDNLVDHDKKLDLPSYLFSELLYDLSDKETTKTQLLDHILNNLSDVANSFKSVETTKGGKAFLQFLEDVDLYKSGDAVDWKDLIRALTASKEFDLIHKKACDRFI